MARSKPQADVKPLLSQFLQAVAFKKGTCTKGRIGLPAGLHNVQWMILYRVNKLIRLSYFIIRLKNSK